MRHIEKRIASLRRDALSVMFDDSEGLFCYPQARLEQHLKESADAIETLDTFWYDDTLLQEMRKLWYRSLFYRVVALSLFGGMIAAFYYLIGPHIATYSSGQMNALLFLSLFLLSIGLILFFVFGSSHYLYIDNGVCYAPALVRKGWVVATEPNSHLYRRWASRYDFFKQGDKDQHIPLRIYGNYRGYDFCYFEYAYTVKHEEEEYIYDSDDDLTPMTEITYEECKQCGIFLHTGIEEDFLFTEHPSDRGAIHFSHLAFEKTFALYGDAGSIPLRRYFDPKNRLRLLERKDRLFYYTDTYTNIYGVLSVFSKDEGFFTEGETSLLDFYPVDIIDDIIERLDGPVTFSETILRSQT